jgi:hypothetical protein
VLFRTFETVAVDTAAAFATSRIVTLIWKVRPPWERGVAVAVTGRSIDEKKILDNANDSVIFPGTHFR